MGETSLRALQNMPISFPGLFGDWEWNPDPIALHIGHGIYWYGIILACAMLAGMFLAAKQAPRYGLKEDHLVDLVLFGTPCCILGSRIYYCLFYLDLYRNESGGLDWGRIIAIWDGGIAIYGTVIMGVIVAILYARHKHIPIGALMDAAVPGLLLGQVIGRWANFINREAFGGPTDLPWRMRLWVSSFSTADVHPTFFYESMWNLIGLLLIVFIISKGRRFDGESTCFYFLWYGIGRFWIEGLRTDSLYLFNWRFLGERIRVSQALSALLVLAAAAVLFVQIVLRHKSSSGLYVNRAQSDGENPGDEGAEAAEEPSGDKDEANVLEANNSKVEKPYSDDSGGERSSGETTTEEALQGAENPQSRSDASEAGASTDEGAPEEAEQHTEEQDG